MTSCQRPLACMFSFISVPGSCGPGNVAERLLDPGQHFMDTGKIDMGVGTQHHFQNLGGIVLQRLVDIHRRIEERTRLIAWKALNVG